VARPRPADDIGRVRVASCLKMLFNQERHDRSTVRGRWRGVPFSGNRPGAFASGHAIHVGTLASAARVLPPRQRNAVWAVARPVTDARRIVGALGRRRRRRPRCVDRTDSQMRERLRATCKLSRSARSAIRRIARHTVLAVRCRPRGQDMHVMRRGRDGGRWRPLLNVGGSQQLKLHRRYRETRPFIGRQLRSEGGGASPNGDDGNRDR